MTTDALSPAADFVQRHRLFRAALALSGQSVLGFAQSLGVCKTHVYLCLRGERTSRRVMAAVDELITQHIPDGEMEAPPPPFSE